jgi:hypothetical protein
MRTIRCSFLFFAAAVLFASGPASALTSQTITFGPQGAQSYFPGGVFTINPLATSSSGLAVTYSSLTTGVCSVSGINVNILAAGTCTIAGDQAGNGTYSAAPQVTQNVNIAKRNQIITFGAQAPQPFGPGGTFTPSASSTSGLPVTFSSTSPGVCTASGSLVTIVTAGSCALTAMQTGDSNNNPAPSVGQSVTITASASVSGTSPTSGGAITAAVSGPAGCSFAAAQFIPLTGNAASPPAGSAPVGVTFPQGLFAFTTNGSCTGTVTLTITYPAPLPANTGYWKYGPTTGQPAHWYPVPAAISGNTITLSITDGGLGDDDLTVNGVISDPGGPGATGSIPTLSEWMLAALALILLFAALANHRMPRDMP